MKFKDFLKEAYAGTWKPKGGWVKWTNNDTGEKIFVEKVRPWGQTYTMRHIKDKWNILVDFGMSGKQYMKKDKKWREAMHAPDEYTDLYTINGPLSKAKNDKVFKNQQMGSGSLDFARLVPAVTYKVPLDYPEK